MFGWFRHIPMSRWYMRSLLAGLILTVPGGWFLFFHRVGAGTRIVPYLISLRMVSPNGSPASGLEVVADRYGGPPFGEGDHAGKTDEQGYLFAVRLVHHSIPLSVLDRPWERERSASFDVYIADSGQWRKVGTASGFPAPKSEHSGSWMPYQWYQLSELPAWAEGAEVLHATVEW